MKRKLKIALVSLLTILSIALFLYAQNNWLVTSQFTFKSPKVTTNFNGYKIVHLSDLHNKKFGNQQASLIQKIKKANPDIILFTGDLIDANRVGDKNAIELMERLVHIAPTYYVTGNHEWGSGYFPQLKEKLLTSGVHLLENESIDININGEQLLLSGIDDPIYFDGPEEEVIKQNIEAALMNREVDGLSILLSHRPEKVSIYADYQFDLIFSGHAHGGQVRIPFLGGLVAPHQGFLPTYTAGMHRVENATLVISRGLGNSIIPLRLFNRPEIVVLTLQKE